MNRQSLANTYLDWSNRRTNALFKDLQYAKPANVQAIVEWPVFDSEAESEKFINAALEGGYQAVNFSLLKYSQGKYSKVMIDSIRGKLQHGSAHGSSIKREIKNGRSFRDYLQEDLDSMKVLDPKKKLTLNIDLFAGHTKDLKFSDSFTTTQKNSFIEICKKLGLSQKGNLEHNIIERIITDVASVFADKGYKIVFEIPGSKGWSMLPRINEANLKFINSLIELHIPTAGICIDVGHVMTWSRNPKVLESYLSALKKYSSLIHMLHISSAGSWSNRFMELYRDVYGEKMPDWHVKSLDVTLAVCEGEQIKFINKIREFCKDHTLLEVSENRTPQASMDDYFEGRNLFMHNSSYFGNLIKQGHILGYV